MTTNLRPLHDRILIKRIDENEQIPGSIIIPDTAKEKPQQGVVIAHAHQAKESISSMKGLEPQGRLNKSAFLLDLFFRFYQLSNSFFLTLADIKGLIP